MGRHRSDNDSFSIAGWLIAVIILVIALIAAAIWWFGFRTPTQPQAQECIQGDLVLPVAQRDADAQPLIDSYNESGPIVRDHCITAELVDSPADAAVLIAPDADDVDRSVSSTTAVGDGISAFVLAPAGDVTEEQTRAAAEFAAFQEVDAPVTSTSTPAPSEAAAAADTLILFDTSAQSEPVHQAATDAIAQFALDLANQGQQVALWNYSSPLNPGVTQGWRTNVSFTDGSEAAQVVQRFGTGGVPQTRSALVAAVGNAAEHSRATGEPARVVLVTTGTEQDMDEAAFQQALDRAKGEADIEITVLHVGDTAVDPLLNARQVSADELSGALNDDALPRS